MYCGYRMYNHNVNEVEKRALDLKKVEDKLFEKAKLNINKKRTMNTELSIN